MALISGWDVFVLLGLLLLSSPFIVVSLVPPILIVRRIQRGQVSALIGCSSGLATLWIVPFGLIGLLALFDNPETAGDDPWWIWLAQWLTVLSVPVFVSGGFVGWFAAIPAPSREAGRV
jgi:hypothetical protein